MLHNPVIPVEVLMSIATFRVLGIVINLHKVPSAYCNGENNAFISPFWLLATQNLCGGNGNLPSSWNILAFPPPVELTSSKSIFSQSAVHGSVVTKWLGIVKINNSQGNIKEIM